MRVNIFEIYNELYIKYNRGLYIDFFNDVSNVLIGACMATDIGIFC